MFEDRSEENKGGNPMTGIEALARKYNILLPGRTKISELDITLTEEELEEMSTIFLKTALLWKGSNMEYVSGYAALSTACAMQILLRKGK